MQSLFLTAVFSILISLGFSAAFAASLGFVWVDIVKPQSLAYAIITDAPLSLAAAFAAIGLYFIKDRRTPPRFNAMLWMLVLFAACITLTTMLAPIPARSWPKWDWAIKVLVFALFIPYVFRSRVQIEAFILVLIFSASTIFFSTGVKTMLGSGGYGTLAIMGTSNSGLSESSTLAAVCVILMPLIAFMMRHSIIFPRNAFSLALFCGLIVTALATVVGTGARTGLLAVGVLCILSAWKSHNKKWWIAAALVGAVAYANIDLSATRWGSRMSTIESFDQDSSALGRLKVWEWTLGYVQERPLGGGFDAFIYNRINSVDSNGDIQYYPEGVFAGKAFHSIYFEVLGEQGIAGFILYFALIGCAMLKLRKLRASYAAHAGMAWAAALADALLTAIIVFLVGGTFVGIAYQPFIFYLVSLTITLEQYAARAEQAEPTSIEESTQRET